MPRRKPAPAEPPAAGPNGTAPTVARPAEAKTRVGFYMVGAHADRARAAYVWTRPHTGIRSFSDFIADAVAQRVRYLESEHNDGQPFRPVTAGELPTGRPVEV